MSVIKDTYFYNCKYGIFCLIKDDLISDYTAIFGSFAITEINFFEKIINKGDIVIEIGTNIGTHTIPISKFIENGKLICFEPQKDIFMILCTNIVINKCDNVIAYNYAISNTNKSVEIKRIRYNTGQESLIDLEEGNDIFKEAKIKKIKYFKELNKLEKINFIKIDAEGMEYEILNELQNLISKHKPKIFLEFYNNQESILNLLYENNYNIYQFFTNYNQYNTDNIKLENKTSDHNIYAVHTNDTCKYINKLKQIKKLSDIDINYTIDNQIFI
jgi:FkbM family methyltransferase